MIFRCPGSDFLKQPTLETKKCSHCGSDIEIWSDEPETKCPECGTLRQKKNVSGCIEWCQFAKYCVDEKVYTRYLKNKCS